MFEVEDIPIIKEKKEKNYIKCLMLAIVDIHSVKEKRVYNCEKYLMFEDADNPPI